MTSPFLLIGRRTEQQARAGQPPNEAQMNWGAHMGQTYVPPPLPHLEDVLFTADPVQFERESHLSRWVFWGLVLAGAAVAIGAIAGLVWPPA